MIYRHVVWLPKVIVLGLAAVTYGWFLVEMLMVAYVLLIGREVIAGMVLLTADLAVVLLGGVGALLVYIKARRLAANSVTALTWAACSAVGATAGAFCLRFSTEPWFPEIGCDINFLLMAWTLIGFILTPVLIILIMTHLYQRNH